MTSASFLLRPQCLLGLMAADCWDCDAVKRGVKFLLETLGVSMCSRVNDKGDNYYTALGLSTDLERSLKAAKGVFSGDEYAKAATPFISLVKEEIKGAYETRKCLGKVTKSTVWGWKNPRQAMLIPIIRAAFGTKPKIIITVRDPRDVCNARNQEQFEEYCPILLGRPCVPRTDCYSFWAHVHYQFFELYNKRSQQICLVRIEDLFQDPTEAGALSPGIVKRISDSIGIEPEYDDAIRVLSEVSKFNNALVRDLMMPDSGDEKATKQQLLRETAFHGDPRVKQVMKHLGYSPIKWELIQPQSKMLC